MAKRRRKKKEPDCTARNCLVHDFWPQVDAIMGKNSCYSVDENTGEVIIHTGLRALPDLELVPFDEVIWYTVKCDCGNMGSARQDMLEQGKTTGCPYCSASSAQLRRN
jgi:hypothetical protein